MVLAYSDFADCGSPATMEEETLDQFSIILTKPQSESLKDFNDKIRRCEDDSDKFSLCKEMRTRLLAQHNSVGTFIAVIEQVMLTVCPEYKSYKRKRHRQEKVDDDEEWQRFIGVAADGNEVIDKCLPNLKAASLVWGRDKIQHYCWHHRGWSFCKKLGTVARMMTWQDFVIKANRLLWRRATVDRRYRRRHIRDFQIHSTTTSCFAYEPGQGRARISRTKTLTSLSSNPGPWLLKRYRMGLASTNLGS
jgi:hypothetical protein